MYRQFAKSFSVYCQMWPCDRECGLFHERFLSTTKLRKMRTLSKSVDQSEVKNKDDGKNSKEKPDSSHKKKEGSSVFDEIMEIAAKKNSHKCDEAPLPHLPEELLKAKLGRKRKSQRQSIDVDTTMIFFDNPVWDDAKFRKELFDSDEELYFSGHPPSILEDEDDTLDHILKETTHDKTSNPIHHFQTDETILSSDDDNDYSSLDLSQTNNKISEVNISKIPSNCAEYEKSITEC